MVEQLISSEGGFSETLAFAPGPLLPSTARSVDSPTEHIQQLTYRLNG